MTSAAGCAGCSAHGVTGLQRLGRGLAADLTVALAGNPNTGKSTLFNTLSGLRRRVGNWSGTTVSSAEGGFRFRENTYRLVDLPGAYTLLAAGNEEQVTRDFLLVHDPDATVVVVDATRLERTLPLALQILELTGRVVVALNLIDEARATGLELDRRQLDRELGVPTVPIAARTGDGLSELLAAVESVALGPERPPRTVHAPGRRTGAAGADPAVERLAVVLAEELPGVRQARWLARRLLDGDPGVTRAISEGTLRRELLAQGRRSPAAGSV